MLTRFVVCYFAMSLLLLRSRKLRSIFLEVLTRRIAHQPTRVATTLLEILFQPSLHGLSDDRRIDSSNPKTKKSTMEAREKNGLFDHEPLMSRA